MNVTVATLGFPRIGPRRELKFALEKFWAGKSSGADLLDAASALRAAAWARQHALGVDWLPSNDFSLYDHVLDMSFALGAIPERYGAGEGGTPLATYFAMARGTASTGSDCPHGQAGLTACEMTKWFDTNYHFMVPELAEDTRLVPRSAKVLDEFLEAKALGFHTRPVLIGPVTWLSLAKGRGTDPFERLDEVLAIYRTMLGRLAEAGADWVQIDEPILAADLSETQRQALTRAYAKLSRCGVRLMLTCGTELSMMRMVSLKMGLTPPFTSVAIASTTRIESAAAVGICTSVSIVTVSVRASNVNVSSLFTARR